MSAAPESHPPSTPASETQAGSSSTADVDKLESWVKGYMEKKGLKLSDLDDGEMHEVNIPAFYVRALNCFVEDMKKGLGEAKKGIENAEGKLEGTEKLITTLKETVEDSDKVIKTLMERHQALGNLIDGQAILIIELYRQIQNGGSGGN